MTDKTAEKAEKVEYFADKTIATLQAENERLEVENQSLRGAANSLKMHYEEVQAENEKLKVKLDFAKVFRKETEAEVDKVVRCRECEHYHKGKEITVCDYDYCNILYYVDGSHRTVCEEDYCSYGKKRGNKV